MEYTHSLNKLINALHSLPGIGPKMAERLSFHVLKMKIDDVKRLSDALIEVKQRIRNCSICGSITESDPCVICRDTRRDKKTICVVEQPQDVWAVERTREYKGLYHVLLGALSPLDGIGPDDLSIKPLLERMRGGDVQEVIVATNPTVEGEATAMYLSKLLKPIINRITRIAHGVPVGADLEYTDGVTIAKALEGRNEI
ncbi:MAG: recombination mediator RecR [Elusimicrobiota bacterium]